MYPRIATEPTDSLEQEITIKHNNLLRHYLVLRIPGTDLFFTGPVGAGGVSSRKVPSIEPPCLNKACHYVAFIPCCRK
jgi:hypothetical protein